MITTTPIEACLQNAPTAPVASVSSFDALVSPSTTTIEQITRANRDELAVLLEALRVRPASLTARLLGYV